MAALDGVSSDGHWKINYKLLHDAVYQPTVRWCAHGKHKFSEKDAQSVSVVLSIREQKPWRVQKRLRGRADKPIKHMYQKRHRNDLLIAPIPMMDVPTVHDFHVPMLRTRRCNLPSPPPEILMSGISSPETCYGRPVAATPNATRDGPSFRRSQ